MSRYDSRTIDSTSYHNLRSDSGFVGSSAYGSSASKRDSAGDESPRKPDLDLGLALISVPWMLLPIPLILKKQHEARHQVAGYKVQVAQCSKSSGVSEEVTERGVNDIASVVSAGKHSVFLEVGASLIKFIRGTEKHWRRRVDCPMGRRSGIHDLSLRV